MIRGVGVGAALRWLVRFFGCHPRDAEGDLALDFKTGTEVCSFVTTLMLSKKEQAQSVERNKDEKKEDKKSDDA